MKKEEQTYTAEILRLQEAVKPLVESGFGEQVKILTIKHGGTKLCDIPEANHAEFIREAAWLVTFSVQEKLMRAAQKFAISFDKDRRWDTDIARLEYTLVTWRELALAALEFSKSNTLSQQP